MLSSERNTNQDSCRCRYVWIHSDSIVEGSKKSSVLSGLVDARVDIPEFAHTDWHLFDSAHQKERDHQKRTVNKHRQVPPAVEYKVLEVYRL